MGQFDGIITGVSAYLLVSALLMSWLSRGLAASKQHQFAFVTITLLILGVFPQLKLDMLAPGIVLSLSMMLFVSHLSAYYSGTPKISVRIYTLILLICALALAILIHPALKSFSLGRFAIAGSIWLLLLELERIISARSYKPARVEISFLWVWFISSSLSLMEPQIQRLPDFFFLILLLTHMEKRWSHQNIPAPIVALYGILFMWFAHFLSALFPVEVSPSALQILFIVVVMIGLLTQSFRTQSLPKRYLYLFITQETLLTGLKIDNIFIPNQEYAILLRVLIFVALNGLFVMIESSDDHGLDSKHFRGLFHERPRFTTAVLIIAVILAIYPLVYFSLTYSIINVLLGGVILIGLMWVISLIQLSMGEISRNDRILRPSLSIWATVVFTILWASVAFIEILSRSLFS